MAAVRSKHLVLILAREFASNLATPMLIADERGVLVFYNEAAEEIFGRPFAEAGEMPLEEWTSQFAPRAGSDASRFRSSARPAGIALYERRAAHERHPDHELDGVDARGRDDRVPALRPRRRVRRDRGDLLARVAAGVRLTIWGCRGSVPTPGAETVDYGGNTSCVEVALDDGSVLVLDAGTGIRRLGNELAEARRAPVPRASHPPAPRPPRGPPLLCAALRRERDGRHLGAAFAGVEPPRPDRALVLAAALPDRPPGRSRQRVVPRRSAGAVDSSGARRSRRALSSTRARRSATGSRRPRRASLTSPTTSPRWPA